MFKSTITKWAAVAMMAIPAGSILAATSPVIVHKATPVIVHKVTPVVVARPKATKLIVKKTATRLSTIPKVHRYHHKITNLTAVKKTAHPLVKIKPRTTMLSKTTKKAVSLKTTGHKATALKSLPLHTATKLTKTSAFTATPHIVVKMAQPTIDGINT